MKLHGFGKQAHSFSREFGINAAEGGGKIFNIYVML